MVNPEKVKSLLERLSSYAEKLGVLASFSRTEFLPDFTRVESGKHLLQVSIECCLDISHHIISSERFRSPGTYVESFEILAEQEIITTQFLTTLKQMARFRNRLVHIYWEIDDGELYEILQNHLGDFDRFAKAIIDFMYEQGQVDL